MNRVGQAAAVVAALAVAACSVGPDYRRPAVAVPTAYKEAAPQPGWQKAQPADRIDRGAWWTVFHDPALDRLERQVALSNQTLKAVEAAFHQSEALVAEARAGYFPTASADAAGSRARSPGIGRISNSFSLSESASWIPDLWGRVRRTVEGDIALAQASAGDAASARLAAQTQLASDYMQLRTADELKRLFDSAAAAYRESLRIARNQYNAGIVAASDVAQAQTQLAGAEAQAIATGVLRAQLEHAIAVLIGRPPAALTISPTPGLLDVPAIPAGLPAALLQRRPDIAAAERRVAAANAQIGVAETAFFPTLSLSADSGVAASMLSQLLTASSRVWSLGSSLAQTVFDAGARHAQVALTRAAYDAAVANYRQSVLTGFQQVEDQLAALRILAREAATQQTAVTSSQEAARILFNQYKAGIIPYTNVVVAQTAALSAAETAVNLRQSRLVAAVALVAALGGGWDLSQLPSGARIERDMPLNFLPFPPADAAPKPPRL
ncbi:MAG TPA: efflux transporter outer membrane subunit [Stellaceae bacterium]|nr:efflux transporter outer membrane subunit [Stellaceae bacterium]